MRSFLISVFLLPLVAVNAQQISIIPQPKTVKLAQPAAYFNLSPVTVIVLEGSNLENAADFLNDYLLKYYSFQLQTAKNSTSKNSIRLNFDRMDNPLPGAYNLS